MASRRFQTGSAAALALLLFASAPIRADPYADARAALLREIAGDVRMTEFEINKNTLDERVLRALGDVPRHEFVPEPLRVAAYENRPLPIGYGQTISQPYIVAIMTDLLGVQTGDRVLEIGTGSGYQAAILAHLAARVYTIEIKVSIQRGNFARYSDMKLPLHVTFRNMDPSEAMETSVRWNHYHQRRTRNLFPPQQRAGRKLRRGKGREGSASEHRQARG